MASCISLCQVNYGLYLNCYAEMSASTIIGWHFRLPEEQLAAFFRIQGVLPHCSV